MSYGTDYLDIPELNPKRVGRISTKMSKTTTTQEPVKASKAKYSKTRGEHVKDLLIAMLVTGIIAFIGGMHFSNQQNTAINSAVKSAVAPSASAQAVAAQASK